MKHSTNSSEVLCAGSEPMEWVGQGPDTLYFAFLLLSVVGIVTIATKIAGRNPHACAHQRENLQQAGRKFMRALDSLFRRGDTLGDDKQGDKSLPSPGAPALHAGKALSKYYRTMVGIMFTILRIRVMKV